MKKNKFTKLKKIINNIDKITFIVDKKELFNTDIVLSKIIVDLLIQYKLKNKRIKSIPFTYKKHVKSDKKYKWNDKDGYNKKRWDWIIDEMIYCFREYSKNSELKTQRIKYGRKLFYIYFTNLWI